MGSEEAVSEPPDSRDWLPPTDMRSIFRSIHRAEAAMRLDGDGEEAALNFLIEAVEELAKYIAVERGHSD